MRNTSTEGDLFMELNAPRNYAVNPRYYARPELLIGARGTGKATLATEMRTRPDTGVRSFDLRWVSYRDDSTETERLIVPPSVLTTLADVAIHSRCAVLAVAGGWNVLELTRRAESLGYRISILHPPRESVLARMRAVLSSDEKIARYDRDWLDWEGIVESGEYHVYHSYDEALNYFLAIGRVARYGRSDS